MRDRINESGIAEKAAESARAASSAVLEKGAAGVTAIYESEALASASAGARDAAFAAFAACEAGVAGVTAIKDRIVIVDYPGGPTGSRRRRDITDTSASAVAQELVDGFTGCRIQ